jgi:Bacterial Ig domain
MKYLLVISFALVFPLFGVLPASTQNPRRQQNRPPSIESFTSSSRVVEICPWSVMLFKPEVDLIVNASDPDGDTLDYKYSVTEGSISGKGMLVSWNLDGLPRGPHEVRVTVTDGKGGKVDAALKVSTVDAGICDRPPPTCPIIEVSCPAEMDKSKAFIFSAVVQANAKGYKPPSFYWTVNAGRIVKGQDSREIEVTTLGANGFDKITATVDVGGFDPSCTGTTVSCSTKIIW